MRYHWRRSCTCDASKGARSIERHTKKTSLYNVSQVIWCLFWVNVAFTAKRKGAVLPQLEATSKDHPKLKGLYRHRPNTGCFKRISDISQIQCDTRQRGTKSYLFLTDRVVHLSDNLQEDAMRASQLVEKSAADDHCYAGMILSSCRWHP